MTRALRFLRVVDAAPKWMAAITAAIGVYALSLTWMDPAGVDNALGMLLLWQMLAASRGFTRAASAGHFDPILVRVPRPAIAAAHGLLAISAVAVVWICVGLIEMLAGTSRPLAFEPGRVSAFVFVSLATWALSLPAPRLVAGSLWLAIIVGLATTRFGLEGYADVLANPAGAMQQVRSVAFVWLCPFVMLDEGQPVRPMLTLSLAAGAVVAASCGAWFVTRRNYPLEPSL